MKHYISIISFAVLLNTGCGPKKSPASNGTETPNTEETTTIDSAETDKTPNVPVEEDARASQPVVAEEPTLQPNADFQASLVFADGSNKQGQVIRVERGVDWYAEDGWADTESKLTLSLESGDNAEDVNWTQVESIDIRYGRSSDVDCQYDSTFNPWMYMCVLKSTPTIRTTNGKTWTTTARHKWKFTFSDESEIEFYIYKLPHREQDSEEVGFGDSERQNFELYKKLQDGLMQQVKTNALTKLKISASN